MLNHLQNEFNESNTANGAFAYKSTKSNVLDLFALGGAYRNRSDKDVAELFSKAYAENPLLAMKTLFYLRDRSEGQGERRFFKVALKHLALHNKESLLKNLHLIPFFGRWDDMWVLLDTSLRSHVIEIVRNQLSSDWVSANPSLLAKWMPSENASSYKTKKNAKILREGLGATPREYRKVLSRLRKEINIVENKMSAKKWDEIEYDKLPSKAGLIYRNAFYRNDEERYQSFIDSLVKGEKKVNSSMLYPYEIVGKALEDSYWNKLSSNEIQLLDSMWQNLPNFIGEREENSIAVVDTSGSMSGTPMNVAISLGIYLSERNAGTFHNHFFTFSANPKLVKVEGSNIVDKVGNMHNAEWGYNTDVKKVFTKILKTAVKNNVPQEEMIDKVYIISDMQFDACVRGANSHIFKTLAEEYAEHGYQLPSLVFWNVNASMSNTPFTKDENGVMLVSGFSPSIFKSLLGKEDINPYELMLEVIESDRYAEVTV